MTTIVKIKGLDRGDSAVGAGLVPRGFRIRTGLGQQFRSGTNAFETIGTLAAPNSAVTYTSKYSGALGNNVKVVHSAPSGSGGVTVTTTYATTTGYPTITVVPAATGASATALATAAAVNADPVASKYVTASVPGTGASIAVVSADLAAILTMTVSGTVSGGTFTLTFPGFGTTTALNYNDSTATMAAAIQVAIRLNPNNASATVTGSGTAMPTGVALFTFGASGGTNLAFPVPTLNSSLTGGGTYLVNFSGVGGAWGRAAAGTFNGGLDVGTGQPIYQVVNSKSIALVDVDDAFVQRNLQRNKSRWISLGTA